MAKSLSTSLYRASHGKRPGGKGVWAFEVRDASEASVNALLALTDTFEAQVYFTTGGTIVVILADSLSYGDATRRIRRILATDRNATIEVAP